MLLDYPEGFLVSYSTSFGNDAPSFSRYMGKNATLVNVGGEGSPRYELVEEKGVHEDDPNVYEKRAKKDVLLPGDTKLLPTGIGDEDLHHMQNWFECLRSRQQPHATVHNGYGHSVACIMAARSYWERQAALLRSESGGDPRPPAGGVARASRPCFTTARIAGLRLPLEIPQAPSPLPRG